MALLFEEEKQAVVGTINVSKKKGNEKGEESSIDIPAGAVTVPPVHAVVGYRISHTKNLGNYESLRVEVSISKPCETGVASIEACYAWNKDWADGKMESLLNEMEGL